MQSLDKLKDIIKKYCEIENYEEAMQATQDATFKIKESNILSTSAQYCNKMNKR